MSKPHNSPGPVRIGKYEIESELGRGGMGVVYRARDTRIGRLVALKTLTESLAKDQSMLQRFYLEAKRAGKLSHPNIVTIFDLGDHDGHPYIVMEFLVGETLDALIKSRRDLPMVHRLKIMSEVCLALAHAHENDVIHRDVKPLNVMILTNGRAKLLDFGLAIQEQASRDMALTQEGSIIGTTAYMAPERLSGATVDGRSDIFATGVMMFQLLTGSLPFTGANHEEVAHKILYEPQPPLHDLISGYPVVLDEILRRALEKEPARRYQSADQMAVDLSSALESALQQYQQDLIADARRLGHALDLEGAREKLEEVLRWNPQHTEARKMFSAVKERLSQGQKLQLAEDKRRQAEQAIFDKQYDAALVLLEQARKLCPDNTALATSMDDVRQKQQNVVKVNELCMDAEAFRRKGDFVSARAKYENAMELDAQNSRLRLAYGKLLEDASKAENQERAKSLLLEAGASLHSRDFEGALASLELAESMDPTNPRVHAMTIEAQEGLRGEERRSMLAELEGRIAAASSEDELLQVAGLVNSELERMPGDASLLRFRLELDQKVQSHRNRKTVNDTAESCRRLLQADDLAGARECVHQALARVPGNGHLLALAGRIEEQIRQKAEQSRMQSALLLANQALTRKDYATAVSILTQCLGESYSEDVADLLQIAQDQLAEEIRHQTLTACHRAAQDAMRSEDYAAVIAAIEPVLELGPDETLQQMLQRARAAEHERASERNAALDRLRSFASRGLHEQIAAFATGLNARVGALPEVISLVEGAAQSLKTECDFLKQMGEAYSVLATENPSSDWSATPARSRAAAGRPALEDRMWASLSRRRETIANDVLRAHCVFLRASAGEDGATIDPQDISRIKAFVRFAAKDTSREWLSLSARYLPNATHRLLGRARHLLPGSHRSGTGS